MTTVIREETRTVTGGGTGLSGVAIRRPVFTAMVMVGLVVMGLFSYRRLAIDQFPAIDLPIVTVQTTFPGASAEGVEREVTRRLEEAFNPVQGVRNITSVSVEGVSQVIVHPKNDSNNMDYDFALIRLPSDSRFEPVAVSRPSVRSA